MSRIKIKDPKFDNIPQFTRGAHYVIDVGLKYLEESIQHYVEEDKLELNPDFQRAHVWTKIQQEKYVEYFLRGGMSSRTIYFNHPGWQRGYVGQMVIVDGKQRLQALRLFLNDTIKVFGWKCSDYKDSLNLCGTLKIAINNLETRKEVLQWYLDLNDGGVAHTSAEIEKVRKLLKKEE